jgi:hypothetical protein
VILSLDRERKTFAGCGSELLSPKFPVDLNTRIYLRVPLEGTQMKKKQRQAKKAKKSSKRTEVAAKPEDEIDTDTMSASTEVSQVTPAIPEAEVAVETQHEVAAAPATPATASNPTTRSEAAKANIKEGLRLHQIAGRPTKEQLILVFGKAGYLLTWPKRTEKFGITPETFQAALAKGVPAIRLGPGAQTVVEDAKEKA